LFTTHEKVVRGNELYLNTHLSLPIDRGGWLALRSRYLTSKPNTSIIFYIRVL